MTAIIIDRKRLKADTRQLLRGAPVSPKAMVALYLGIALVLDLLVSFVGDIGIASTFISVLTTLLLLVLSAGFTLFCMDIRNGEETGLLTLFDGFSFVGKIIGLHIVMSALIFLWSMLFLFPGVIAAYRYRFAIYNLLEDPGLGIFEALNMSKRQTMGYKVQLFMLDVSYVGWMILADLPSILYSSYVQVEAVASSSFSALVGLQPALASPEFLPAWGWLLVTGLWNIAAALFYLPHRTCTELGYFLVAKQTSGVSADVSRFFHNDDSDPGNDPTP